MGRIVALNKFISKATDKCLFFFKILKQDGRVQSSLSKPQEVLSKASPPEPINTRRRSVLVPGCIPNDNQFRP